ncbi:juvenile hormone acid O-methyltransferase-like [Branchiostoma lanceolatum]|uniref:juvenile hormone acid O-methyltransferase-like n=1 Tax=Branchiostoma lanceolatum TaxID=7740 RepID=UPI0034518BB5
MDTADAVHYSQNRSFQDTHSQQFLGKHLEWVEGDTVLDVGCGTGETTRYIARQNGVKAAVGFDVSPQFIRHTNGSNTVKNATFFVADVQNSSEMKPEWRESFSKAVSFYVLQWVGNKQGAVRNIASCLQPGGELLMTVPTDDNFLFKVSQTMAAHARWQKYLCSCPDFVMKPWPADDEEGMYHLLQQWGFEMLTSDCPLLEQSYCSKEEALKALHPFMATGRIPPEEMDDYLADWWRHVCSTDDVTRSSVSVRDDGTVTWTVRVFVVHAQKR